jgi:hypothetical protein
MLARAEKIETLQTEADETLALTSDFKRTTGSLSFPRLIARVLRL